jgi:hypothetical protein
MTQAIQAGDKVRSYDFEGRRDCYVEGVVSGFEEVEGCNRYVLRAERRVIEGREVASEADTFYPPVNGTPRLFGGVCDGVELIEVAS